MRSSLSRPKRTVLLVAVFVSAILGPLIVLSIETSNTFRIIRAANHIAKDTFRTISVATVAQFGLIYVIAKRLLDRVVVASRD